MFVTLEDETGNVNVVVWTSVQERFRAILLQGQLLSRERASVEREKEVIHVVAGFVEDQRPDEPGWDDSFSWGPIVLKCSLQITRLSVKSVSRVAA